MKYQKRNNWHLIVLAIIFLSCNEKRIKIERIKNFTVQASFLDHNVIDGKARYFDSLGRLVNISTFSKGIRNGVNINYYPNGIVSDSVEYIFDKENGYWTYFDTSGIIGYSDYYYFGLGFGPTTWYENGQLQKYQFRDFNHKVIAEGKYTEHSKLDSIQGFHMNLCVTKVSKEGGKFCDLFGYLPEFPNTEQIFSIGLTNKNQRESQICAVKGKYFFIDTLLPIPPQNWFYYLGCHIRANGGAINKFFIEEVLD